MAVDDSEDNGDVLVVLGVLLYCRLTDLVVVDICCCCCCCCCWGWRCWLVIVVCQVGQRMYVRSLAKETFATVLCSRGKNRV